MGENIAFTAVIITHGRETLCRKACESVREAADRHAGDVELLLVNSSDRTISASWSFEITEIHAPEAEDAVEKRNLGIEEASKEWIAFVDDDCQIAPHAFEVVSDAIAEAPETTGAFYPVTEFSGPVEFPLRCCDETHFTNHFYASRHDSTREWAACTLAVFRRDALEAVGRFDESFATGAGGEDVDLGLRLDAHGYEQHGIPETLVYHDASTWNSLAGNLRRFFYYGLGETFLQRKHPDRVHFKLNALGTEVGVLVASILVFGVLRGSTVWLVAVPLFALLAHFCYGVYNRAAYGKSLLEGLVLRTYDYAFEAGNLYNSVRQGSVRGPFYRHKSDSVAESRFPFGREKLIYGDEVPTLLAALATFVLLAVASG